MFTVYQSYSFRFLSVSKPVTVVYRGVSGQAAEVSSRDADLIGTTEKFIFVFDSHKCFTTVPTFNVVVIYERPAPPRKLSLLEYGGRAWEPEHAARWSVI